MAGMICGFPWNFQITLICPSMLGKCRIFTVQLRHSAAAMLLTNCTDRLSIISSVAVTGYLFRELELLIAGHDEPVHSFPINLPSIYTSPVSNQISTSSQCSCSFWIVPVSEDSRLPSVLFIMCVIHGYIDFWCLISAIHLHCIVCRRSPEPW